ncbi:MAG: dTDP-4-dehydrorhamnose reductase [Gemmataceae bacterium]
MAETIAYLILGGTGQLGSEFARRLGGSAVVWTRQQLDLADYETIIPKLARIEADVLINCAAYNYVDQAEDDIDMAFRVNAYAPWKLAQFCRQRDLLLVHFSTDYVFGIDTQRRRPYHECDRPTPVNVYGASKLAGECLVAQVWDRHLIVRTCGLYGLPAGGGKRGNFVETILAAAQRGQPLRVVHDQICTPTSVNDVAAAVLQLIAAGTTGLVHMTNAGYCTWYEFASRALEYAGVRADIQPIGSDQWKQRATRPHYSVLESMRPDRIELRPWQDALRDYIKQRMN